MNVNAVNQHKYSKRLSKLGVAAGLTGVSAYIAKNFNDIFVKSARFSLEKTGYYATGLKSASGWSALFLAGGALVGGLLGKGIGILADKHQAKKSME